jgi:imidazole glycerol-phosphate synthase subunit HisH
MIAIVDYGMGNLQSVQKALERVGASAVVTRDPAVLEAARGLVLPGVGAFGDAMANLRSQRLLAPVLRYAESGKPLLGICLGMQLLFDESEEMGRHQGLGLLPGQVVRFPRGDLRVPHVGWNEFRQVRGDLLASIRDGAHAYFVHSYFVAPEEPLDVLATTEYGIEFAAVVGRGSVYGAQFHPEKSQEVGLQLLKNFVRLVGEEQHGGDHIPSH